MAQAHQDPVETGRYLADGWWGTDTLGAVVARHAATQPGSFAFISGEDRMTWSEYDARADALAAALVATGMMPGTRVAVILPDGIAVHVAFLAAERAGFVVVGIGARAGDREVRHLLRKTGATALITHADHQGRAAAELLRRVTSDHIAIDHHVVVPDEGQDWSSIIVDGEPRATRDLDHAALAGRAIGPDELFLVNSTSGTTGLPKCVMHNQNRWFAFHRMAVAAGALVQDDVFLSIVPAPFGFGLWTAHFTPTILGSTTVLLPRFNADDVIAVVDREHATVLSCVSTQFIMLLNSPALVDHDVTSLRSMFTGGEAVPYERAAEFEERTGAAVLQFYGSNETGALSCTTLDDPRDLRLTTAGRTLDVMRVRLFDDAGNDVTATGRGQPGCRGPVTCFGYLDDDAANDELFTADGWMLCGDEVVIEDGVLRVIGRKSDVIIRGGKNISAPAVEEEVDTHPSVALAAALAVPDPVFGERVCVVVQLVPGTSLSLEELVAHLEARGVTREWFPEKLVVVDELPRSSGGTVAKGELRARVERLVEGASVS